MLTFYRHKDWNITSLNFYIKRWPKFLTHTYLFLRWYCSKRIDLVQRRPWFLSRAKIHRFFSPKIWADYIPGHLQEGRAEIRNFIPSYKFSVNYNLLFNILHVSLSWPLINGSVHVHRTANFYQIENILIIIVMWITA